MSSSVNWHEMLADFRRLGGIAENIEQRVGALGNGIFPIDVTQPIDIYVPPALLLDADQYVLQGGDLVVNPELAVSDEVRHFLNCYQKNFSWGADGQKSSERFERALAQLPTAILAKLKQLHLLNLEIRHKATWDEVVRQRFLQSRRINYHDRKVSMPIIELINHGTSSPGYLIKEGIRFKGNFDGEVTVNYSLTSDAMLRFLSYGFANLEPRAYSIPTRLKMSDGIIVVVGYDLAKVERSNGISIPRLECEGQRIRLSHLLIGAERTPRVPRTIFRETMKAFPTAVADELFDRFRGANQQALCDLLDLAEGDDSEIVRTLPQAVRNQLRAMSHAFGVRPLPAKP